MQKELPYFHIEDGKESAYGGEQDWFGDWSMRVGGCAAVTACDTSIYLDLYREEGSLYPYDVHQLTRDDYLRFGMEMKPYLRPRWTGIDRLDVYIEGFSDFLYEHGADDVSLTSFSGRNDLSSAEKAVRKQILAGLPIPYLNLQHQDLALDDYVWHWFLLTGFDDGGHAESGGKAEADDGSFCVKVVTYGSWRWLDLGKLWETGFDKKGGMVLLQKE